MLNVFVACLERRFADVGETSSVGHYIRRWESFVLIELGPAD